MIAHRIVLCLGLLTASVGFAQASSDVPLSGAADAAPVEQTPPPVVEAPQETVSPEMTVPPPSQVPEQAPVVAAPPPPESAAQPPGELIPYHYQPENEGPGNSILGRVVIEAFGGVLGGVGMGIVGLLAGASALEDVDCSGGEDICAATVLVITIPAVFVGIPLGVQMAGQSAGGRGQFLPSLGGTLLGTALGAMYGLTSNGSGDLALGLIVGPVVGAILGYEISDALARRGMPLARATSHSGPSVAPVVGATPHGGFLGGLAGRF